MSLEVPLKLCFWFAVFTLNKIISLRYIFSYRDFSVAFDLKCLEGNSALLEVHVKPS